MEKWFFENKKWTWPSLKNLALSIEHVGSTAVEGLVVKPIIDIDIVIASTSDLNKVIEKLNQISYMNEGDLGKKLLHIQRRCKDISFLEII